MSSHWIISTFRVWVNIGFCSCFILYFILLFPIHIHCTRKNTVPATSWLTAEVVCLFTPEWIFVFYFYFYSIYFTFVSYWHSLRWISSSLSSSIPTTPEKPMAVGQRARVFVSVRAAFSETLNSQIDGKKIFQRRRQHFYCSNLVDSICSGPIYDRTLAYDFVWRHVPHYVAIACHVSLCHDCMQTIWTYLVSSCFFAIDFTNIHHG